MKQIGLLLGCAFWGALVSGEAIWASAFAAARFSDSRSVRSATLDQYGGYVGMPVPGGATGQFRVGKLGNRWVFATPLGNAFWLRSVYVFDTADGGGRYQNALNAKYGGFDTSQEIIRLKSWGFNALDSPHHNAFPMYNAQQIPFLWTIQGTANGFWGMGYGWDIMPPTYRLGAYGHFPDVFSPLWNSAIDFVLSWQKKNLELAAAPDGYPWLIGFNTDDGDYITGFKGGPHLGWVAACTAPSQTGPWTTPRGTQANPSDPKVYTKYALRDYLANKYSTVSALNAAWGSTYTTFDSSGGWPSGSGLLDESGQSHAWLVNGYDGNATARANYPNVWADLDAFMRQMSAAYFAAYKAARDHYYPHHLLFTTESVAPWTPLPVLQGMAPYVDAVQSTTGPPLGAHYAGHQQMYNTTGKPIFLWTTVTAQTDSNLLPGYNPNGWGSTWNWPNQAQRGAAYAQEIANLLALTGDDGSNFILGINWWEWTDKTATGENMNFGLVSNLDNAYDGKEAIIARETDPRGHPTGGEKKNYGDFLTSVGQAHDLVYRVLTAEFIGPTGLPPKHR